MRNKEQKLKCRLPSFFFHELTGEHQNEVGLLCLRIHPGHYTDFAILNDAKRHGVSQTVSLQCGDSP